MACFHPLTAWRGATGAVVFDEHNSASKVSMKLPCGRCIGCRSERARQWGVRCLHEKRLWPHNAFVTLTYEDEFLPPGGTLVLRDLQLFMKRLRFARADDPGHRGPVRFFAAGEYGEDNARPHYHLLLFNCGFSDLRQFGESVGGSPTYTSKELSALWPSGFHTIGEITMESAVYCAKYCMKKLTPGSTDESRERFRDRYQVFDGDGVVYDRKPEFAVMSRRPGIGFGYYEKFGDEVRNHDNVVINGKYCRPPRYYDDLTERVACATLAASKRRRRRLCVLARADNTEARLLVKERIAIMGAERAARKL